MYTVAIKRRFAAFHFLTGASGRESRRHVHQYALAVEFEGDALDRQGYLVDIAYAGKALDRQLQRYRRHTLNDLAAFTGLNPSIEHFARVFCRDIQACLEIPLVRAITVTIAENRNAAASFRMACK